MSKRARHPQTGRFVKTVPPAWPELDINVQEALAAHVFTGDVSGGGMQLRLHMPHATQHAYVTVHAHVRLAARVCKAWKKAFDEWLPKGIAGASARAWRWAISAGLEKCQYSGYVAHIVPGPYLPLDSFLPPETKVEWKVLLHDRVLATLTLTRRRQDVVGDDEVVEGVEHLLKVVYKPVRAPRMVTSQMPNAEMAGHVAIHIPDVCWTETGVLRGEGGESAVEQWTREKKAFLERWVLHKHGQITRDWRVTRQSSRVYYWG